VVAHSCHWGAFDAAVVDGKVRVRPVADDPDPARLLGNIPAAATTRARVLRPHVRRGWLEQGPGADLRRGSDVFVPVSWEEATRLLAGELGRVVDVHGSAAVFGGSYGWASAGRFHHAQSQLHRFLNLLGGYVGARHTYSHGASEVLLPRVVGCVDPIEKATAWPMLVGQTGLVVCFGGMPRKNAQVNSGGITRHVLRGNLTEMRRRGTRFVLFSPLRDDLDEGLGAEWRPLVPGTDTAVMLALAYVLASEDRYDHDFVRRYCTGYEVFERYLLGREDGVAKTPEWAERISTIPAATIAELARDMARQRTLVSVSWSLQRTRFGEQPVWAGIALAAMLGQIGLPGGGFAHSYGSVGGAGVGRPPYKLPTLPQGTNPVAERIPVARIADMLLNPGGAYDFNGQRRSYPDIRLVYWSGGNPFHHHQDLTRLRRAFGRP
jgi:biotin/methionine sulfoxide reductase